MISRHNITVRDMKKWLLSDQQNYDLTDIKKPTLLMDRVRAKEPKSKVQWKNTIKSVWKEINSDKNLCKNLISSISKRLGEVIAVNGKQIRRSTMLCYRGSMCPKKLKCLGSGLKSSYGFIFAYRS